MAAKVELRDVRKTFGKTDIIKGVSLSIEPGEFVVFVGPSGCGKSTLLRLIAGLEEITSGALLFDDAVVNEMGPAKRGIGMVFQSYALYPHMTVAENVGFGLKLAKIPRTEREDRVSEALKVLQIDHLAGRKPSELSGGQRQRVAIGRAIVRKPNVFLFDEPLSNLDTDLRVQMRMEIGRLHRRLGNTVVYVTHDQVEAMTLADRIVVFEAGNIRQVGTPIELYERPANRFVAGFIGTPKMGFFHARLVDREGQRVGIALRDGKGGEATVNFPGHVFRTKEGEVVVGIRPEHCWLDEPEKALVLGEVLEIERLGADTFAFIDVEGADESIAVRVMRTHQNVAPGDRVGINFDPAHAHLFDPAGARV